MGYDGFYRYIYKTKNGYRVMKDGETYGTYDSLAEALYERDRFIAVDWDWGEYVYLQDTINGYIHINLPPFHHDAKYVALERESWIVCAKGSKYKYYGLYHNKEEAEKVALIYNARISHRNPKWKVQRNGKTYGYFKTEEAAIEFRDELIECGWDKNEHFKRRNQRNQAYDCSP